MWSISTNSILCFVSAVLFFLLLSFRVCNPPNVFIKNHNHDVNANERAGAKDETRNHHSPLSLSLLLFFDSICFTSACRQRTQRQQQQTATTINETYGQNKISNNWNLNIRRRCQWWWWWWWWSSCIYRLICVVAAFSQRDHGTEQQQLNHPFMWERWGIAEWWCACNRYVRFSCRVCEKKRASLILHHFRSSAAHRDRCVNGNEMNYGYGVSVGRQQRDRTTTLSEREVLARRGGVLGMVQQNGHFTLDE